MPDLYARRGSPGTPLGPRFYIGVRLSLAQGMESKVRSMSPEVMTFPVLSLGELRPSGMRDGILSSGYLLKLLRVQAFALFG